MSPVRVVVTGMGCVTPVGNDMATSWDALLRGKSGAAPITLFDASDFSVRFACEVKNFDAERFVERKKRKELDRFAELAMAAASMAISDAGLSLTEEEQTRAGCFVGVGLGGLAALEQAKSTLDAKGPSKLSPYSIPRIIGNLAAGHISIAHSLRGPSYATTSACATGGHALGEAAEWIRRGRADVMVAGGAESTITPIGIGGFQAMHALSRRNDAPERASRPFDRGRDGFVCGEGSGVLVLESYERAHRTWRADLRRADRLWRLERRVPHHRPVSERRGVPTIDANGARGREARTRRHRVPERARHLDGTRR